MVHYHIHKIIPILPNKPREQFQVVYLHITGWGTKSVPKSVPERVGIRKIWLGLGLGFKPTQIWSICHYLFCTHMMNSSSTAKT